MKIGLYRRSHPRPIYVQEEPTYILLGRTTHLFHVDGWWWTRIAYRHDLKHVWAFKECMPRPFETEIRPVKFREWWKVLGVRGLVELAEDYMGFRLLSRWTDRWRPPKWMRPGGLPFAPPRIEAGTEEDCEREAAAFDRENRTGSQSARNERTHQQG